MIKPRPPEVRRKISESLKAKKLIGPRHYSWRDPVKKFWDNTERRGDGECWAWKGGQTCGYGSLKVDGQTVYAHIYSFKLHGGVVPPGHDLHHQCTNVLCVNPSHLKPITKTDHGKIHRRQQLERKAARTVGDGEE